MSIPEAAIEAARDLEPLTSVTMLEAEDRARDVILALAENLPESAVEEAARELHDRVVVGGDGYVAACDDVKAAWNDYARAAIIAGLKDVAEGK